jgi:hypothetical protein
MPNDPTLAEERPEARPASAGASWWRDGVLYQI